MSLWIAAALLAAAAGTALALALMRRQTRSHGESARAVYRDQLAEIERDRTLGLVGETDGGALKNEIERRLAESVDDPREQKSPRGRIAVSLLAALGVPALALLTYVSLGAPDMPDQPHSARIASSAAQAEMRQLLDQLEQRLAAEPGRLDGWLLLARSRMKIGDHADAADAFRQARDLAPQRADIAAELGEALIHAAGGAVPDAARAALIAAHARDPRESKALFYLGHDAAARGDHAAAVQFWTDLVAVSPPGAPWIADVNRRIQGVAAEGNIDIGGVEPSIEPVPRAPEPSVSAPAPGPSKEDVEAAEQMSPEERAAFVRSMVERLAARLEEQPEDIAGWRRLAQAWRVLGETQKAEQADARIRALEQGRAPR